MNLFVTYTWYAVAISYITFSITADTLTYTTRDILQVREVMCVCVGLVAEWVFVTIYVPW